MKTQLKNVHAFWPGNSSFRMYSGEQSLFSWSFQSSAAGSIRQRSYQLCQSTTKERELGKFESGVERRRTWFGCIPTSEMLECACLRVLDFEVFDLKVVKTGFPEDVVDLLKSAMRCCQPAPPSGWIILHPAPSNRDANAATPPPPLHLSCRFQCCWQEELWL